MIAKLVSGGAGQDGVRQRVKDFDRGVLDVGDEDDSDIGNEAPEADEGSDFEDSLSKKKAQRARARRSGRKKPTAFPYPSPFPPVPSHGYPMPSHPAMPSTHSMATRRRSLSTPSLPTVPAISSTLRRPKAHNRTYSDLAAGPSSGVKIAKGRTTNNSMAASTVFPHIPIAKEEPEDEALVNNPIASGYEQKLVHEKRVKMQREQTAVSKDLVFLLSLGIGELTSCSFVQGGRNPLIHPVFPPTSSHSSFFPVNANRRRSLSRLPDPNSRSRAFDLQLAFHQRRLDTQHQLPQPCFCTARASRLRLTAFAGGLQDVQHPGLSR